MQPAWDRKSLNKARKLQTSSCIQNKNYQHPVFFKEMDEINKRFRVFLKSWYCCLSYSHSVCLTQALTVQLYLLLHINLCNSLIYCYPTPKFKLLGHANIQLAETKKEKHYFQHRGGKGSIQEKCRRKRRRKNTFLLLR